MKDFKKIKLQYDIVKNIENIRLYSFLKNNENIKDDSILYNLFDNTEIVLEEIPKFIIKYDNKIDKIYNIKHNNIDKDLNEDIFKKLFSKFKFVNKYLYLELICYIDDSLYTIGNNKRSILMNSSISKDDIVPLIRTKQNFTYDMYKNSYSYEDEYEKKYIINKYKINTIVIEKSKYNDNDRVIVKYYSDKLKTTELDITKNIKEKDLIFKEKCNYTNEYPVLEEILIFDIVNENTVIKNRRQKIDHIKKYEESIFNKKPIGSNILYSNDINDLMKFYKYFYLKNDLKI